MSIFRGLVDMGGKPLEAPPARITPLSVLKDIVAEIESGALEPEAVFVIVQKPSANGKVTHPTWDSGVSVAEAIYLMETVKSNLLDAMKR